MEIFFFCAGYLFLKILKAVTLCLEALRHRYLISSKSYKIFPRQLFPRRLRVTRFLARHPF